MGRYLLTLLENSGGHEHFTRHIIEAEDRQMVKYHFHRTLKDFGYRDTQFDKHCLEGHNGLHTEIHEIQELAPHEYDVMDRYINRWTKV